jgi:branched-chain amino acid transport system permease protein
MWAGAASLALLCILPWVVGAYVVQTAIAVLIQSIAVIGLGLLTGFAGRISLAQGALVGVGAYTAALLATRLGVPPWFGLPAAIGMACLVGTVLGAPAIRLSGLYFVMSTIAIEEIVTIVLMHWTALTGGPQGVRGIPALSFGSLSLDSPGRLYYATLAGAAVSYFLARRLIASRFGLFLRAVSDDELASATSGVAVLRTKVAALALSSAWAGAAGFLHAYDIRFVHPDMYTLDLSVVLLTMAIFGGERSLGGMLVSTAVLGSASEYLRPFGEFRMVAYGVLLLGSMMFFRTGLFARLPSLLRGGRRLLRRA